jgi:two-component system heavy metal sensor histidine kinase CusS
VITTNRSSFRLRLALQTTLVAGVALTGFGAGAWWFALEQQARNHDLRIAQEARRLWMELTPRHREEDFARAAETIFGNGEVPVAVGIVWHTEGNPSASITGPELSEANRVLFLDQLPTGPAVVKRAVDTETPQRQARALSSEMAKVGAQRRPLMPEIRTPGFFTVKGAGEAWRYGAFSNPHYTLFVGFPVANLQAGARRTGWWFAGGGLLALAIAGVGAWWSSGRAIRPLDRIVSISNRMSAGNLDEGIPLHQSDDREFAQLIGSLNNMTARLRESFEQAVRFTADASHELKTPLAVMQSTLNEAMRSASLDEAAREQVGIVLHQVSRLKHITHSLLLLSQADAGELPVTRECYDLSKDLEGLMEDAQSLCASATLAFEKQIACGVFVEADRALMHQVFQNLVSNAVKHNQPGGRVEVKLHEIESGARFEISNTSDEGASRAGQRLFERFYRTETSRLSDGFGLGLNIARELSLANGAKLELVALPAGMTGFSVSFEPSICPVKDKRKGK